jgi:PadR family transcriptional regulator PadR
MVCHGAHNVVGVLSQPDTVADRIARAIQSESDNVLVVDHGSLYPALQRLEDRGFIGARWGMSENNRKARFYTLTARGRKELVREESEWRRIASAIMRVLGAQSGA